MKFAALEKDGIAKVVEVKGCATCPHMQKEDSGGVSYMKCHHGGKGRSLTSNWAGAYHATCPLPSKAEPFTPTT